MVMMNIKLVQRGVNSKLNGIGPVPVTHCALFNNRIPVPSTMCRRWPDGWRLHRR